MSVYLGAFGWLLLAIAFCVLGVVLSKSRWHEWALALAIPAIASAFAALMTFLFDLSLKWQLVTAVVPFALMSVFLLFHLRIWPRKWH
uniref:hypothetical protein n=1 Tax=Pseudomonas sp. RW407 TaxID=2202894 RepID=UPI001C48B807|nr:hypothetical protein [Pseudomonas sp. RW407]